LDRGFKAWSAGGEVNSTISLVRSRPFDLAIAPSVGLQWNGGGLWEGHPVCPAGSTTCSLTPTGVELFAKVPVLAGIPLPFGHELVFGPEVVVVGAMESNAIINAFQDGGRAGVLAGGMAGVSIQLPHGMRLMPELTVLTPAVGFFTPPYAAMDSFGGRGAVVIEAAVGFSFGGGGA